MNNTATDIHNVSLSRKFTDQPLVRMIIVAAFSIALMWVLLMSNTDLSGWVNLFISVTVMPLMVTLERLLYNLTYH